LPPVKVTKCASCGQVDENNQSAGKQSTMTQEQNRVLRDLEANMVWVEGGTFTMGATSEQGSDAEDDELPAHQVTLSGFYMCKYEVTQELWQAVMGTTISQKGTTGGFTSLFGEGSNYPMYFLSWDDCQEFITRLNEMTGKRYRLPTEAEWEYAARGGNKSRGYKYAGSNTLDDVAWYYENSEGESHPVGQKQPNELGLYDMNGNVLELCQDRDGTYDSTPQTDPTGPSTGFYRVYRGGAWAFYPRGCRVSDRASTFHKTRGSRLGLRLAL